MRPCPLGLLLGAILACAATQGSAASRNADPDWPCQQRLVPKLSSGLFWTGPSIADTTEWRKEPEIVALVEKITPRNIAADRGKEAIGGFIKGIGEDKPRRLTLAFAGLLEETNRQRAEL